MAKRTSRRTLPVFPSEQAEREYWETHDASPFVEWSEARRTVFPNLKASTETISLRLPTGLLSDLKILANKQDVPYQSLLKVYLAERVTRERNRATRPKRALQPSSRSRRRTARG